MNIDMRDLLKLLESLNTVHKKELSDIIRYFGWKDAAGRLFEASRLKILRELCMQNAKAKIRYWQMNNGQPYPHRYNFIHLVLMNRSTRSQKDRQLCYTTVMP